MERDRRDAAHVDADRRQDSLDAQPVDQSFVARHSLRDSRGLTTSPIPYDLGTFEITFDFIDRQLRIEKSDGARRAIELKPRSVADFIAQ
jgi:hypothetical protein